MKTGKLLKLALSLALPIICGGVAGLFTAQAVPEWYASLNRPVFNPPNYLFGPVWTTLYILMGISCYIIWTNANGKILKNALLIYGIQLILNFAWSFIFFYFQNIGLALIEISVLWIFIIIMLIEFYKIKPLAAFINIPYLLWVSFATVLTAAYYILNKS